MAAGDFSAAAHYAPALLQLQEMWNPNVVMDDTMAPLTTAKVIMERHGLRSRPILDQNGRCVTRRNWWLTDCDYAADYDDTTADGTLGCDPPLGTEDEAVSKDYDPNVFIYDTRSFLDQDCDNLLVGVDRTTETINRAVKAVRKSLATRFSALIDANAQANTYTSGPGTINGTATEFNASEFGSLKLLTTMKLIAMKNKIANTVSLSGTNFYEIAENSVLGACCEDGTQRNLLSRNGMFFDIWLDEAVGSLSTFVVDPSRIGFVNFPRFANTAPMKMHGNIAMADATVTDAAVAETWGWSIADPVLMHQRTDANGQTTMQPVRYDVEYRKICIGRDSMQGMLYRHDFTVFFNGGLWLSPAPCNDSARTGILKFDQV